MKIINENPPNLEMIIGAGMKPTTGTIYTYGDTIYVPNGSTSLPDDLIEHERVHSIQQGSDPDAWWTRFINDQYFRIDQESEAYGYQYNFLCKKFKDRNKRNLILLDLSRLLSSPIYGSVVNQSDARRLILNKSNIK